MVIELATQGYGLRSDGELRYYQAKTGAGVSDGPAIRMNIGSWHDSLKATEYVRLLVLQLSIHIITLASSVRMYTSPCCGEETELHSAFTCETTALLYRLVNHSCSIQHFGNYLTNFINISTPRPHPPPLCISMVSPPSISEGVFVPAAQWRLQKRPHVDAKSAGRANFDCSIAGVFPSRHVLLFT